ncbi:hypothetical protein CGCTS75_v001111 [Colletotrichum tropicale]|nr:hypothetical protein CGCTS75_v001111 [Colletotrichum tropicale]
MPRFKHNFSRLSSRPVRLLRPISRPENEAIPTSVYPIWEHILLYCNPYLSPPDSLAKRWLDWARRKQTNRSTVGVTQQVRGCRSFQKSPVFVP